MGRKRDPRGPRRRSLVGALGLFLIAGCEAAPTPVAPDDVAEQLPQGTTSVTSLVGDAARREWISGLIQELNEVDRQIRSVRTPSQELLQRATWLGEKLTEASSHASGGRDLSPRTNESPEEGARIISFGTQVRMPYGGPFAVVAHTQTSRVTGISHKITIVKTIPRRQYSIGATDQTGLLGSDYLMTSVPVSGDCSVYTTLDAATEHAAGGAFMQSQTAMSTGSGACGTPPSCGGDGDAGGGELMTSMSPIAGPSLYCSGGGPDSGGGGATYTCYTVTLDHYWYYPDTDTYEYRYSEESTWCEQSS